MPNNKNNKLIPFILGAASAAVVTWLVSSEDGKKTMQKMKEKLGNIFEEILPKNNKTTNDSNSSNNTQ